MKLSLLLKIALPVALVAAVAVYAVNSLKPTAVVAPVERSVAVRAVPGTVQVKAEKDMAIKSERPGRIARSWLESGKAVESGDLLVQLDTGDIDLAIERAQAELKAARRTLELESSRRFDLITQRNRLADLQRQLELGSASQSNVDEQARRVTQIEEAIEREKAQETLKVEQLENELRSLRRDREKMTVRSPIDGIVAERFVFEGDLIGSGQTLARVISNTRLVEVKVSEENFAGLKVGQQARVRLLGYGERTFEGVVSRVIPVADPETQRYTIHLDLEATSDLLFPGLTGEASITLDQREKALIVPRSALLGNNVFVVRDGVVSVEKVEPGFSSLTSVEIRSGLEEGDLVIVENLDLFRDGDSVVTQLKS